MDLSRNLLCEIKTAMGVQPNVMSEKSMSALLQFNHTQNDTSSQEVYDIDNQFAKDRFTKYLLNMQIVLDKPLRNNKLKTCRTLRKQIKAAHKQETPKMVARKKRRFENQNCAKVLESARKQTQNKRLNMSLKV